MHQIINERKPENENVLFIEVGSTLFTERQVINLDKLGLRQPYRLIDRIDRECENLLWRIKSITDCRVVIISNPMTINLCHVCKSIENSQNDPMEVNKNPFDDYLCELSCNHRGEIDGDYIIDYVNTYKIKNFVAIGSCFVNIPKELEGHYIECNPCEGLTNEFMQEINEMFEEQENKMKAIDNVSISGNISPIGPDSVTVTDNPSFSNNSNNIRLESLEISKDKVKLQKDDNEITIIRTKDGGYAFEGAFYKTDNLDELEKAFNYVIQKVKEQEEFTAKKSENQNHTSELERLLKVFFGDTLLLF